MIQTDLGPINRNTFALQFTPLKEKINNFTRGECHIRNIYIHMNPQVTLITFLLATIQNLH